MTASGRPTRKWGQLPGPDDYGYDFEGTRKWQAALGQTLTPSQRLDWLESTVREMRELVGLARKKSSSRIRS